MPAFGRTQPVTVLQQDAVLNFAQLLLSPILRMKGGGAE